MNQFGPSALINLSNFSSIKPEPASTPPQGSMASSTAVVKIPGTPGTGGRLSPENNQVLTKKKLQDLVREVDPNEQLDEDVEEMLLQIADDFIESVVTAACQLARHRKSSTLEVKNVQLHLERQWNMWIPGFSSEEIRPYKKACTTEAHKQVRSLQSPKAATADSLSCVSERRHTATICSWEMTAVSFPPNVREGRRQQSSMVHQTCFSLLLRCSQWGLFFLSTLMREKIECLWCCLKLLILGSSNMDGTYAHHISLMKSFIVADLNII